MKTLGLFTLFVVLIVASPLGASDRIVIGGLDGLDPNTEQDQFTVLLALSGGGARGLATIGILSAFEQKGIATEAIAGTSMGGIVGGLYASGFSANELDSIVRQVDFSDLFSNRPSRLSMFQTQRQEEGRQILLVRLDGIKPVIPQALTAGQKLTSILTSLTARATYLSGGDFDALPIPFKTICTDIVTGHEVVIDSGVLADAMRGTMAFPLAFTPLEAGDYLLMDGGLVTPIPVSLVRSMGEESNYVVAVNTVSPLLRREELVTPIDFANQATSIMTADELAAELAGADYVIEPPLGDYTLSDFSQVNRIIRRGYESGLSAADSIQAELQQRRQTDTLAIVTAMAESATDTAGRQIAALFSQTSLTRAELITQLKDLVRQHRLFELQVTLTEIHSRNGQHKAVAMAIATTPSMRLSAATFRFVGTSLFDDSLLASRLPQGDEYLTSTWIAQAVDSLEAFYRRHASDLAAVEEVSYDPVHGHVTFVVDEAIVRRIDVLGSTRTKDWFVRSLLPLNVNEPYRSSQAAQGIANIYGTNLFDRVSIGLTATDSGAVVTIGLKEKEHTQLRFGWHWHDEYESEEYVELRDPNIGGIGLEYIAHLQYGHDREVYNTSLKLDRIWSTYLTVRFDAYHTRLDRQVYDSDLEFLFARRELKSGLEFQLGQQIARFGTVSAGLKIEHTTLEPHSGGPRDEFGLAMLRLESLVETFDRVPFTETGNRHLLELQFADEFLGGKAEFTKVFTSIEGYFPISRYLNYHPKLNLGVSRSGLPASEKFYLGGQHSFFGYRTNQLAGDKVFLLSNELRLRLPFRFYVSVRHDMGDVYGSTDQIKIRNVKHAVGATLALDSPIGPMEFSYGVVEEDRDRFYVHVGHRF